MNKKINYLILNKFIIAIEFKVNYFLTSFSVCGAFALEKQKLLGDSYDLTLYIDTEIAQNLINRNYPSTIPLDIFTSAIQELIE